MCTTNHGGGFACRTRKAADGGICNRAAARKRGSTVVQHLRPTAVNMALAVIGPAYQKETLPPGNNIAVRRFELV